MPAIPEHLTPNHPSQDPMEFIVRQALVAAGVQFDENPSERLDFYLPDQQTYIECKQFYTPRIADQLQLAENVILIQGVGAALAFYALCSASPHDEEDVPLSSTTMDDETFPIDISVGKR